MPDKQICGECGTELPLNAPQGLCPRCLADMGLGVLSAQTPPKPLLAMERAGNLIGRYQLLDKIGEGGFDAVFMAQEVELGQRRVALKIIKPGLDSREAIVRFEAGRQAIAAMDHPGIARVLDAGTTETGRPYFVTELVGGMPITDYCDQNNSPIRERLQLFVKVCEAVQHAHQKGVIHRDLKPGNLRVSLQRGEPVVKVMDFGVAEALGRQLSANPLFTGFRYMTGTPAYMSPEQAAFEGLEIDTRADIYSLGVLLYELLTGVTPLDPETLCNATSEEIRRMIRVNEPVKPSRRLRSLHWKLAEAARRRGADPASLRRLLDGDLDWMVMKCLEKERERRYETVHGLTLDIQRHLAGEPIAARPPARRHWFQRLAGRNSLTLAVASAVTGLRAASFGLPT